jgi:hypothetical protein
MQKLKQNLQFTNALRAKVGLNIVLAKMVDSYPARVIPIVNTLHPLTAKVDLYFQNELMLLAQKMGLLWKKELADLVHSSHQLIIQK